MRIEDLFYSLPSEPINEKEFNLEKWRQENPMDYLKAIYLTLSASNKDEVFRCIYNVTRLYIPDTLYKYYSLTDNFFLNKQKFDTLSQGKVYMSKIRDFNDPFDGKAFYYDPNKLKHYKRLKPHGGRLIDDFTVFSLGTALTANGVNSMPMWAHYANNHAGFCVSYDMKHNLALSSCTFPVQYTNQRLDITTFLATQIDRINKQIDKTSKTASTVITIDDMSLVYIPQLLINIKHSSWSYECEFRCSTAANGTGMPYLEAMPKEIYIGINCTEENIMALEKIANKLQIPIYRMGFDECSPSFELTVLQ